MAGRRAPPGQGHWAWPGLPARSALWRDAAGRLPARHNRQQLGNRLQVGDQPADPRTWPPHRDDVLSFPRTGHVSSWASPSSALRPVPATAAWWLRPDGCRLACR